MGGKERKRAKREQEVICLKVEISRVLEKLTSAQNLGLTKMTPPFEGIENFDYGLRRALDAAFDWKAFGDMLLHQIPARTLVFARGGLSCGLRCFSPRTKKTPSTASAPGRRGPGPRNPSPGARPIWTKRPRTSSRNTTTGSGRSTTTPSSPPCSG